MPIGEDAIAGYTFKIEIDGQVIAQFKEVSGLSSEVGVIEHRENNLSGKEVIKKLPGQKKWGDITLKRGKTDNKVIWEWHKLVMEGKIDEARKNGSIVLYDYAMGEMARYNFVNAWPSKASIGSLQAGGTDVLMEEVTLVHEGIELA
ncbi:MAG: phage tail protein [Ilumatobacteraceae bacterium]|jgi:phage tail-like protein|nr:phage tail protein [Ilumatobacteraceae bacterium]